MLNSFRSLLSSTDFSRIGSLLRITSKEQLDFPTFHELARHKLTTLFPEVLFRIFTAIIREKSFGTSDKVSIRTCKTLITQSDHNSLVSTSSSSDYSTLW